MSKSLLLFLNKKKKTIIVRFFYSFMILLLSFFFSSLSRYSVLLWFYYNFSFYFVRSFYDFILYFKNVNCEWNKKKKFKQQQNPYNFINKWNGSLAWWFSFLFEWLVRMAHDIIIWLNELHYLKMCNEDGNKKEKFITSTWHLMR